MLAESLKTLLTALQAQPVWLFLLILLAASLIYTCCGYRFLRFFTAAGLFVLGLLGGIYLLRDTGWKPVTVLVISAAIGVLLAVLSVISVRIGLFLLSGLSTYTVLIQVLSTFLKPEQHSLTVVISVAAAIFVAFLIQAANKGFTIITMSLGGGVLTAHLLLYGMIYHQQTPPKWLVWMIALFFVGLGIYMQSMVTSKKITHVLPSWRKVPVQQDSSSE